MVVRVGKKAGKGLDVVAKEESRGGVECEPSDEVLFRDTQ
jgi:hypothetical protein